jgi:hypothetical protein
MVSPAFEGRRDAGGPARVMADGIGQADGLGPAFDQIHGVAGTEWAARQRLAAAADGTEEGALLLLGDTRGR